MRSPLAAAILVVLAAGGAFMPAPPTRASGAADADADVLEFTAHPLHTRQGVAAAPAPFSLSAAAGPALQIVQFDGPIRQAWLDELKARGITPVQYVPSNGYLVWADEAAQGKLAALRTSAPWLRYASPYYAFLKLDPELDARVRANATSGDEIDVTVQVYAHADVAATKQLVAGKGRVPVAQQAPLGNGTIDARWAPVLKFENLDLRVRVSDIAAIAERPHVAFVGVQPTRVLLDEKQGLLLSGDMTPGPASVSYLQFLLDRGFSQNASDYPIVDVTDSTIDEGGSGVTVLNTADAFLHVRGDLAQPARVSYFSNCSSRQDSTVGAYDGHGSLNAGIIAGFDQSSGYPYQDSDGQRLGLGINPFVRVGSTAVFVGDPETYDASRCGGSDQGVIQKNWRSGARISSNSWGANPVPGSYNSSDQAYDAGVRDADPAAPGNQEMIYVFAASNAGPAPATVTSPGAGKNVITVGASENLRPFETPPGNICGPDPADNPQNIAGFSGRGPAPGQRAKPEIVAPGTHIQAAASVYSGYTGSGVCVKYYPLSPAQTLFTYSSGTSHSTPAVSGVASLAYWWIEHGGAGAAAGSIDEIGGARPPSPALMKAWLMAHPTYLSGASANDNLPGRGQGYGMPDLSSMFDATPKVVLDQSDIFDNSGETRQYVLHVADPTRPVRIALAYTDAPGMLGTSPQVNDLDLTVESAGQTYLGNHFDHQWSVSGGTADTRNNYEAVFLPAGASGDLTVTVTATNVAGDGVPNSGDETDQDFALVCSNCTRIPSFTLAAPDASLHVCAGASRQAAIDVGQISGFADPVSLTASGQPAGASATFAPNPAVPPGTATLTVAANLGTPSGRYPLQVAGSSGSIVQTLDFDLGIFDVAPAAPSNAAPADGSADVSTTPTFSWNAVEGADRYLVQVATDAAFAHVVRSQETTATAWAVAAADALDASARYYWRVVAENPCGDSTPAAPAADTIFADGFEAAAGTAQTFTTLAEPGECAYGLATTVVFNDDLESGAPGWTHAAASGSVDLWSLDTAAHSGTHAWQAAAPAAGTPNDSWLVSPSIALPANLSPLSLSFWNEQQLKAPSSSGCYDGGLLDVSTDGGTTWTQIATGLLTEPYDGAITSSFGNPLSGRSAWCGDPRPYAKSVVDLQPYAGASVKLRFRLGHDRLPHRAAPNWAIDDVRVAGCSLPP
jgi:hypothetical protein